MVDVVPVVDDQGDQFFRTAFNGGNDGRRLDIAIIPQAYRVVPETRHHLFDIIRRTIIGVFAFQHRPHHLSGKGLFQRFAGAQVVVDQVGHAGFSWFYGGLVAGVDDGPGPVTLVKAQAGSVLFELCRIRAGSGIIGKTLEKEAVHLQGRGLAPDAVVQGAADAAAGPAGGRGDPVQVGEVQFRFVQQHGEPAHLGLDAFGHEEDGAKALFKRVAELFGDVVDFFFVHGGELAAQDLLHLAQGAFVHRQYVVIDSSNAQHAVGSFAGSIDGCFLRYRRRTCPAKVHRRRYGRWHRRRRCLPGPGRRQTRHRAKDRGWR